MYVPAMYKKRNGKPEGALILEQTDLLRTRTACAANRSGLDRTGCNLERNGPVAHGTAADLDWTAPDRAGLDRTRPDSSGPDRTGLDRTGPRLGAERTTCMQKSRLFGPERTRPDQTRLEQHLIWTGPDRTGLERYIPDISMHIHAYVCILLHMCTYLHIYIYTHAF